MAMATSGDGRRVALLSQLHWAALEHLSQMAGKPVPGLQQGGKRGKAYGKQSGGSLCDLAKLTLINVMESSTGSTCNGLHDFQVPYGHGLWPPLGLTRVLSERNTLGGDTCDRQSKGGLQEEVTQCELG